LSIFLVKLSPNCKKNMHEYCINKRKKCGCTCHTKNKSKSLKSLKSVNIIPKTYCSFCNLIHKKEELDFCKICQKPLRIPPSTKFKKKIYVHSMGKIELIMYQRQFQVRNKDKISLKELDDIYYLDQTKAFWKLQFEIQSKKLFKVFLKNKLNIFHKIFLKKKRVRTKPTRKHSSDKRLN